MTYTQKILTRISQKTGMNQTELAEYFKCTSQLMSLRFSGQRGITLDQFGAACKRLKINPCDVMSESDMIQLAQENSLTTSADTALGKKK